MDVPLARMMPGMSTSWQPAFWTSKAATAEACAVAYEVAQSSFCWAGINGVIPKPGAPIIVLQAAGSRFEKQVTICGCPASSPW